MEQTHDRPKLAVVMGVSGSGKSTVAHALAECCGFRFLDADDYHSDEARARMASGVPLDDEMRKPWIRAICDHLATLAAQGESCVLAFSGLKQHHREPLRHTGFDVTFFFLDGDKEIIRERIQRRKGHFMPAKLLESQYITLERPQDEPDVYRLDVALPLQEAVEQAAIHLQNKNQP
jgi:gluconokinase